MLGILLWLLSVAGMIGVVATASAGSIGDVPLVGDMLTRPRIWERATPIAIMCLFSWVLIELGLRAGRAFAQHRAIPRLQTLIAEAKFSQHQCLPVKRNEPRAIGRANLIIECNRKDPSSLHQALPAAAGLDSNALAAGYGALNVYAWILPVLGFVGTASGMAAAIVGFKSALTSTNELEKLVATLSQQVIPGLAAAFETTILALTASLVAYLCTSALRAWDEEALDSLDRVCVVLLSRTPQPVSIVPAPPGDGPETLAVLKEIVGLLKGLAEAPEKVVEAVSAIERASLRMIDASTEIKAAGVALKVAGEELKETAILDVHLVRGRK